MEHYCPSCTKVYSCGNPHCSAKRDTYCTDCLHLAAGENPRKKVSPK